MSISSKRRNRDGKQDRYALFTHFTAIDKRNFKLKSNPQITIHKLMCGHWRCSFSISNGYCDLGHAGLLDIIKHLGLGGWSKQGSYG